MYTTTLTSSTFMMTPNTSVPFFAVAAQAIVSGLLIFLNPPNFAAPIYGGSTNGLPVTADAPPLFIAVADDDQMFSGSSAKLYLEWKAAKRPAELHIYAKGGHGFGLTNRGWPVDSWIDRFGDWLNTQGLLKPSDAK